MKTTTILASVLFTCVCLESATADPPTEAAYSAARQASRIAADYDRMIAGTENEIREMRAFKARFDPTITKATRQHRPKQYWFRSPEHKRSEIAALEASLAAMRAVRWESAIPCNPEAMWSELKVGDLALPTDYSTGKPARIEAAVRTDPDETGRVLLELTWPEYFAVGSVDCRMIFVDGSALKRADSLKLPTLWIKALADTPDGQRFVCEFATDDQVASLEREISRLTHPDRRPRHWADSSGTHQIDGTLLSYDRKSGTVAIERSNRVRIELPISKLSPSDAEFVELALGTAINPRTSLKLAGSDPE